MSRATTEQSDVNNFILHVYLMYANQLEHKKRQNGTVLQKREIVESLSLQEFTNCVDVVTGTWLSGGPGSAGLMVGQNDLRGLFQPH